VVSLRPAPGLVSRTGMWDGYLTIHAQMRPTARTDRDLAKLLDGMVGYDPEDPVTALGIGKVEGSYTRYLDRDGLNGARIGIQRESIGNQSDPNSTDFKIVDAAFEKNGHPAEKARSPRRPIPSATAVAEALGLDRWQQMFILRVRNEMIICTLTKGAICSDHRRGIFQTSSQAEGGLRPFFHSAQPSALSEPRGTQMALPHEHKL
jgi:Asp-tRNA(Asn)/Glu-tRNA(Gln) amidotransferase A subunit family amidase